MTVDDCELGFVGLGAMGACMALRLLKHGGGLAVFDSRAEAMAPLVAEGAVPCSSPADVARRAETVFASLPTPEIVQSVVLGEQGLLNEHAMRTFVDLSTTGPSMAGEIAKYLDDAGVAYLDAPVSGGPLRARDGQLTVMAAGANTVFKEVAPLLSLLASTIVHVGREPGQGQLAKLLNNLLSASAIVITAEALALGVKQGLEPDMLLAAINASSGRNTASADKFPRSCSASDIRLRFPPAAHGQGRVPLFAGGSSVPDTDGTSSECRSALEGGGRTCG